MFVEMGGYIEQQTYDLEDLKTKYNENSEE